MECRQLGQLDTPAGEEGARADEEGVGPILIKALSVCPRTY